MDEPAPDRTEIAWRLFRHIAERDPGATATRADALAVLRECVEAVSHRPPPPRDPLLASDL